MTGKARRASGKRVVLDLIIPSKVLSVLINITSGLYHLSSQTSRYVKGKVHASGSGLVRSSKAFQFIVIVNPWPAQPARIPHRQGFHVFLLFHLCYLQGL